MSEFGIDTAILILYCVYIVLYVRARAKIIGLTSILSIDSEYAKKALHAAYFGTIADWNEIMDASGYFWESRR